MRFNRVGRINLYLKSLNLLLTCQRMFHSCSINLVLDLSTIFEDQPELYTTKKARIASGFF
jgi:hypothetical protein